ncbi:hypothetical protein PIB30_037831 [Stylosanthes scabra]|uniref:Uncharacterized protein n=1 Tax=Stylosanthes scabra TaxID=79078 RepID=A0ABU6SDX8_9FABA|nr:hypothetical protein [Stylosanthes scabra]
MTRDMKESDEGATLGGDWRSMEAPISTRFGALESQRGEDYDGATFETIRRREDNQQLMRKTAEIEMFLLETSFLLHIFDHFTHQKYKSHTFKEPPNSSQERTVANTQSLKKIQAKIKVLLVVINLYKIP